MSVTDGDRERAMVVAHKAAVWGSDVIAKALAEEREKALAPFLALLDPDSGMRMDDGYGPVYAEEDIRRALEESE